MFNNKNSYPKVLILGETFRFNGGGGITLINLFKDWNPDNLAVVTERINETSFNTGCNKFYRLGHLEIKMPFPFNYINKIQISGDVTITVGNDNTKSEQHKRTIIQSIKFNIEKSYYKLFLFLGFYIANYKLCISDELLKWIDEYSPQVIYAQPFGYKDMVFAKKLHARTRIPLVVHFMDDSVSFLNKPNLLFLFWQKRIKNVFKQLIESADVHLSISQAMSDEYYKRYNKTFTPFRNPIEINTWETYIKRNWSLTTEVNVIYTGRLAIPNIHALYTFCQVVEKVNNKGYKVRLCIYSNDSNPKFINRIKHINSVSIYKPVPFIQIPALISKFDIAILPIDFTKKGIKYAKYSISTKTSEYMISGVPILLFAPEEVALTSYAKEYKCMHSVSENSMNKLTDALIELINDTNLRSTLAKKAIEVAKSDSDASEVRNKFKEVLSSCILYN